MRFVNSSAALAALGMLLMSCASSYRMYSGRPLPNNAIAVMRQPGSGPAVVLSVDGKPCEGGITYYGIGENKWELLPGMHRVEVDIKGVYGERHSNGPQTVTFNAEAGYVYDVDYDDKYLGRSGLLSEVYTWKPVIRQKHPVTDADRVKPRKGQKLR